jgi:hypothetical protein
MRALKEVLYDRIISTEMWYLKSALVTFICEAAVKGKRTGTTLTLVKPSRTRSGV